MNLRLVRALSLAALLFPLIASAETKEEEATRYLDTMVQSVLEGNDPMRNRMFIQLRYLGEPSIEPLLGALQNGDWKVRQYAAFTLGFFDSPRVVDPLLNLFQKDPELEVRATTAEALGRLEATAAVDPLLKALNSDQAKIRQSAAYGLGLIGSDKAKGALENARNNDPDELVRFFAGEALDWIERAIAMKNRS